MKRCPMCGETKPASEFWKQKSRYDGLQGYCKPCHRQKQKAWQKTPKGLAYTRKAKRKWSRSRTGHQRWWAKLKADPEKMAAYRKKMTDYSRKRRQGKDRLKSKVRIFTTLAVQLGVLTKLPCTVCGDPLSQAHHPDYTHPLDVVWYCRTHHELLHHPLDVEAEKAVKHHLS